MSKLAKTVMSIIHSHAGIPNIRGIFYSCQISDVHYPIHEVHRSR